MTINLYIGYLLFAVFAGQATLGAASHQSGEELLVGDAELERHQGRGRLAVRRGRLDRAQLLGDPLVRVADVAQLRELLVRRERVGEEELQRALVAQLDVQRLLRREPVVQRPLARACVSS